MRERTTRVHFIISIAVHLLLVLVWGVTESLFEGRSDVVDAIPEEDIFVFEVIETPDDAPEHEPEDETDLVSDKSTRGADENPVATEEAEAPYSAGEFVVREFEPAAREPVPVVGPDPQIPEDDSGTMAHVEIVGVDESTGDYSIPARSVAFKNLVSSLTSQGGMSFNTYEWDFAPYMLAMKRKVERNLHPPYAFTHMGMVSGINILRFTVLRDGTVSGLTILGSDTHFSLDRTSLRAIELSMPFLPLPLDFPEDMLEVTAQFSYIIR